MAIDWNAIYQQEYARLPDMAGLLQGQEDSDLANLKGIYNTNAGKLQSQLRDALTASYVTNELAKRDLTTRLAAQGITGGMTETAADDYLRDYRNTNNTAQKSFDASSGDLLNAYYTNAANTRNSYGAKIAQANADRINSATANANIAYNSLIQQEAQMQAAAGKKKK